MITKLQSKTRADKWQLYAISVKKIAVDKLNIFRVILPDLPRTREIPFRALISSRRASDSRRSILARVVTLILNLRSAESVCLAYTYLSSKWNYSNASMTTWQSGAVVLCGGWHSVFCVVSILIWTPASLQRQRMTNTFLPLLFLTSFKWNSYNLFHTVSSSINKFPRHVIVKHTPT